MWMIIWSKKMTVNFQLNGQLSKKKTMESKIVITITRIRLKMSMLFLKSYLKNQKGNSRK